METKHTPGPWILDPNAGPPYSRGRGQIAVKDRKGTIDTIAWIRCGRKVSSGNARLIAATPDMLEALRRVLNSDMAMMAEDEGRADPCLEHVRSVIAIATTDTDSN